MKAVIAHDYPVTRWIAVSVQRQARLSLELGDRVAVGQSEGSGVSVSWE